LRITFDPAAPPALVQRWPTASRRRALTAYLKPDVLNVAIDRSSPV
jgi:hypothetical protein